MFVMRTNKRRNLTSSQKAAIAYEAEDIIKAIKEKTENERRESQSETQSITKSPMAMVQLIVPQPAPAPRPSGFDTSPKSLTSPPPEQPPSPDNDLPLGVGEVAPCKLIVVYQVFCTMPIGF